MSTQKSALGRYVFAVMATGDAGCASQGATVQSCFTPGGVSGDGGRTVHVHAGGGTSLCHEVHEGREEGH